MGKAVGSSSIDENDTISHEDLVLLGKYSHCAMLCVQQGRVVYISERARQVVRQPARSILSWGYDPVSRRLGPDATALWIPPESVPNCEYTCRWRGQDGEDRWVEVSTRHVMLDSEAALLVGLQDVTERVETNRRLTQALRRHERFLEKLPLGLHHYRLDVDGALILSSSNPAADEMLGISHGPLHGLSMEQAFPQLQQTEIPAAYHRAASRGEDWQTDQITYRDDRVAGAFRVHAFQTGPNEMAAVFQEIGPYIQTAEALRRERDLLSRLMDTSPVGILLLEPDRRVRMINTYLETLLDLDRSALIGRSFLDIDWTLALPDGRPLGPGAAFMETMLQTRQPLHGVAVKALRGNQRFDLLVHAAPLLNDGGTVDSVVCVIEDVTERRRTEAELAETQALFASALEQSPAGVVVMDAVTQRVRLVNSSAAEILDEPRAMLETARTGEHQRPWRLRWPDGTPLQLEDEPLNLALRTGQPTRSCELILETHRRKVPLLANAAPVRDERGRIVAGVTVFLDVSELREAETRRKQLELQVMQSQKLESLGLMAGGIAHDFNNMLVGILGAVDLQLVHADSDAEDQLQVIRASAEQAADLCRQLLAYVGKEPFSPKRVDVVQLLRQMHRLLQVSAQPSGALQMQVPDALPPVRADATMLRQVIVNLVLNAAEALGPSGGQVRVQAYVSADDGQSTSTQEDSLLIGGSVVIDVADNGCGMDDAAKARVFDPFFTTKLKGRGLGLSVVQGIVRAHGGEISLKSRVGQGTTVRVRLPLAAPADQQAQGASGGLTPDEFTWPTGARVLIVDDDEVSRSIAARMLERLDLKPTTAATGDSALTLLREGETFAAALCDMMLPDIRGEELLVRLHAIQPELRIIACSGFSEKRLNLLLEKGLVKSFLPKPYRLADLRKAIAQALTP